MKLKLSSPVPWQKIFLRKKTHRKGMLFSDNTCILFGCPLLVCIESWSYTSSKNEQFAFPSQVVMEIVCNSMNKMWGQYGKNSVTVILYIYITVTLFFSIYIYITVKLFFSYWPYILFIEHLVPVLYVTCKESNCKF
jgi:hypothetical protein